MLWDADSGRCLKTLPASVRAYDVAWDPTGTKLALATSPHFLSIWDTTSGKLSQTQAKVGSCRCVAWSPDGKWIVSGSHLGVLSLVSTATWEVERSLQGHFGGIRAAAWTADGSMVATAGEDGTAKVWTPGLERISIFRGHDEAVLSLAWNPIGTLLASGSVDETIRVWSVLPAQLQDHASAPTRHGGESADGETLLVPHEFGYLPEIVWSPGTQSVWTVGESESAVLSNVHTGHIETILRPVGHGPQVSPDAKLIAGLIQNSGSGKVRIADAATNREIASLPTRLDVSVPFASQCFAWSHDSSRLALSGSFSLVVNSSRCDLEVWDVASGTKQLEWGCRRITGLVWSPDNRHLAVYGFGDKGESDNYLHVLDVETGTRGLKRKFGDENVTYVSAVAWSPDGERLLSATTTGEVRLWNWATSDLLWTARPFGSKVVCAAWHPDGTRVALRGANAGVKLLDPDTGEELMTLPGDTLELRRLGWKADGTCLVGLDFLGKTHFWDAAPGYAAVGRGIHRQAEAHFAFERNVEPLSVP